MPRLATVGSSAKSKKASPDVPTLSYTADGTFTITNYNSSYFYTVTGCTRTGSSITGVSDGATIKVSWASGAPLSAARTMNVAVHTRVLDSVQQTFNQTGCGTRTDQCCSNGWVMSVGGQTCGGAPGTQGDFCGGACPGNCYGYFGVNCWSWHMTDYSGSGYTLIGNTWGKVT